MKFPKNKPGQRFAFWFHWKLEPIERAYKASRSAPDAALADLKKREAEHQKLVDAGKASWVEYDDDGTPGYDHGEHLGEEFYEIEQVLSLVRLAFLVTLHHYWEQQLAARLPRDKKGQLHYDPEAAYIWLEAFGWTPKRPMLEELRLIANCAKHSEGRSATDLFAWRPDLFDAHKIKNWQAPPGYDTLMISDSIAESYFKAVRASVPRMPPTL